VVTRAAWVLLAAACALAAQVPPRFTLGDTYSHVRRIQGPPDLVERLSSLGIEIWSYEGSTVTFDAAAGAVTGWNDPRGRLRVTLRWTRASRDSVVRLGATREEVARVHGTPWAITASGDGRSSYLAYGRSVVRIAEPVGTVAGWLRRDAALRADLGQDSVALLGMGGPSRAAAGAATRAVIARRLDLSPREPPPLALAVSDVQIADASGDGQLSAREFADLTITVRNAGLEPLPALRGTLMPSPGLHLLAGTSDTFTLGGLAPRATAEIALAVYALAVGRDVVLHLSLTSAAGRSVRFALPLPVAPVPLAGGALARGDSPSSKAALTDLPRALARNPDAIAVVIGVESYRRLPGARYARRDMTLIRRVFAATLGVPDDALHLVTRADDEATGSELRRLLGEQGWLARRATANSDVLVYFAGHGAADPATRTPYLLPWDADAAYLAETGIALSALLDRLATLPARSVTLYLDACFTGMARDNRPLVPGARAVEVSIEHPALVRRNMAVFAASRGTQVALDAPAARHGLFTLHVARGLAGGADANGDRTITVTELGRFVEQEVQSAAAAREREQHPVTIARDSLRPLTRYAR
jgi:hypothetical protein